MGTSKGEIAEALTVFLASTYGLYLKTQNFHWNVKGNQFMSLHKLFQKQYEELEEHIDEIAERAVILGSYVEGTFSYFDSLSRIKAAKNNIASKHMIEELVQGHEEMRDLGSPFVSKFADMGDDVSSDLVIKCLTFHEKAIWMLKSHLE